jgi:hypothetical protein
MVKGLEQVLKNIGKRRRAQTEDLTEVRSAAAFRAAVDQRLRHLERQIDEIKGRINGLLFLVVGTALTEIVRGLLQ